VDGQRLPLSLAALILLGGSLGDRFGRRRLFVVGTVWFAIASLLCGLAQNVGGCSSPPRCCRGSAVRC
jgi:MFS family permease